MNGSPLAALVMAKALVGAVPEPERLPARRRGKRRVYLAERYFPDVNGRRVEALASRLEAAADELRRQGADVRFLGSAGLPGDEALLFLFSAPSAEAVTRTVEHAGVAADRIVPAVWRAGQAT